MSRESKTKGIYIPIWRIKDSGTFPNSTQIPAFTFQYGGLRTNYLALFLCIIYIYIPIWRIKDDRAFRAYDRTQSDLHSNMED